MNVKNTLRFSNKEAVSSTINKKILKLIITVII